MQIEYFIHPTKLTEADFKDQLTYFNWDVVVNGKDYDVYSMSKCYHCQGGSGDNNLWCIKRGLEIKAENFSEFEGKLKIWGFKCNPKMRFRDQLITYFETVITRNNEEFYEIHGRDFNYCIDRAKYIIHKFKNFPISFHHRDWKKKLIGRKIWWKEIYPGIITTYIQPRGHLTIIPDDKEIIKTFNIDQQKHLSKLYQKEKWGNDFVEEREILTDLFDHNIDWFRD